MDLTFLDGDRWDTDEHSSRERAVDRTQKFWHDIHIRIKGPAVEFIRDNFVQRWTGGDLYRLQRASHRKKPMVAWMVEQRGGVWVDTVADSKPPMLPLFTSKSRTSYRYAKKNESFGRPCVQIVRSFPRPNLAKFRPVWHKSTGAWEASCKEAYITGIDLASRYIYLENQWVADEGVWAALLRAAQRNKSNPDFRILIVVPYDGLFAAGMGANQELWIDREIFDIFRAFGDEERLSMYGLLRTESGFGSSKSIHAQIYVHSKILIVDDEWSLIGSANAGGISLEGVRFGRDQPDSELSAVILDRKFATDFRVRVWEEHLQQPNSVSATYRASDADRFRTLAATEKHARLRFTPQFEEVYRTVKGLRRTPFWRSELKLEPLKRQSKIVPSFPKHLEDGLPTTLIPAGFRAHAIPAVPPGYRVWFKWGCDVLAGKSGPKIKKSFPMSPMMVRDPTEAGGYWDQDVAYIAPSTAKAIDRFVASIAEAQIRCDLQFVALHQKPSLKAAPDLQLKWPCKLVSEKYAKANLPHFGGTAAVKVS